MKRIAIRPIILIYCLMVLLCTHATAASVFWRIAMEDSAGGVRDFPSVPTDGFDSLSGQSTQADMSMQFYYDADTGVLSDFFFRMDDIIYDGRSGINPLPFTSIIDTSPSGNFVIYFINNADEEAYFQFAGPLTNQGGRVDIVPVDLPYLAASGSGLANSNADGGTAYVKNGGNPLLYSYGGPTANTLTTNNLFLLGTPQTTPIPEPSSLGLLACSLVMLLMRKQRSLPVST